MKINKINAEFEIVELEKIKGLSVQNEEEKVVIYDDALKEEMVSKKFMERYKRLLYIITDINNSDDATDSDSELTRVQIEELRNLLLKNYKKYISKELLNKYLKMLLILESKMIVREKGVCR